MPRDESAARDELKLYRRPGGVASAGFCGAPSPHGEYVWCRRLRGHEKRDDRGHAAFTHSVREPEYWP